MTDTTTPNTPAAAAVTAVYDAVHVLVQQMGMLEDANAELKAEQDKHADPVEHDRTVWRLREYNAALEKRLDDEFAERIAARDALKAEQDKHAQTLRKLEAAEATIVKDDHTIALLREDNAALDAWITEMKPRMMPDHHPVGTEVYCRTPGGVRQTKIDGVRITIGESEVVISYAAGGALRAHVSVFLTADEAFASSTH